MTMSEEFTQDNLKPSYSDIVSGRTVKYAKLEDSTGKSFLSSKKHLGNVKNCKVESVKVENGKEEKKRRHSVPD